MPRNGLSETAVAATAEKHEKELCSWLSQFVDEFLVNNSLGQQAKPDVLATTAVQFITQYLDPDAKGKNTKWIVDRIVAGDPYMTRIGVLDDASALSNALKRHKEIKPFIDERYRDIFFFRSCASLFSFIHEIESLDSRSIRQMDRDRQAELITNHDADVVLDDDNFKILRINTAEAADVFGRGTKWCITTPVNGHFEKYRQSHVYYIILKRSSRKFAIAYSPYGTEFRDECNIGFNWASFETLYPQVYRAVMHDIKKRNSLSSYFTIDEIVLRIATPLIREIDFDVSLLRR